MSRTGAQRCHSEAAGCHWHSDCRGSVNVSESGHANGHDHDDGYPGYVRDLLMLPLRMSGLISLTPRCSTARAYAHACVPAPAASAIPCAGVLNLPQRQPARRNLGYRIRLLALAVLQVEILARGPRVEGVFCEEDRS